MSELYSNKPITLMYRGNVLDTAMIVGLVHTHAPIQAIHFVGTPTKAREEYCESLDRWLEYKGYSKIVKGVPENNLGRFVSPRTWGWGNAECEYAIRLTGLNLPPTS